MIGKPKYTYGDQVKISYYGKETVGTIVIVDAYGTFEQNDEPSYDVMIEAENTVWKHVNESWIIGTIENG
jgi:hypothetical protein